MEATLPEGPPASGAELEIQPAALAGTGTRKGKKRISGAERKKRKARVGEDLQVLPAPISPVVAALPKAPPGEKGGGKRRIKGKPKGRGKGRDAAKPWEQPRAVVNRLLPDHLRR